MYFATFEISGASFFSFLTMMKVRICHKLPKPKSMHQIFYILQSTRKCIRKLIKSWKNVGGKLATFTLDPKLDWATETLVLTSASKFLWLVVHFDE